MTAAYVQAVGLLAPGLLSWETGMSCLSGAASYLPAPLPAVKSLLLPSNERRRAPLAVHMALQVCEEAVTRAGVPAAALESVFATSDADTEIVHRICSVLAEPVRAVSPTDFHNSVHNAAAGYWSIAAAARRASTTIAAHDYSFAAGLREALALLATGDTGVLLALYDVPPPELLLAVRPISQPAAVAMVLTHQPGAGNLGGISLCDAGAESTMPDAGLELLRKGNPAMRCLPLLQRLAQQSAGITGIATDSGRLCGIRLETQ